MLGFAVISSGPGMLELGHAIALPLVLTEHPEARTLRRQKGVCFKMNGFVVFLNPMAPHKMCFLPTLNTGESLLNAVLSIPPSSMDLPSLTVPLRPVPLPFPLLYEGEL